MRFNAGVKAAVRLIVVALLLACPAFAGEVLAGRVGYVVDGDTFQLAGHRVRLWGHDTPERGECGYSQAADALRRAVAGQTVECDVTGKDRYGRTVARCSLQGQDIGAAMVRAGLSADFAQYSGGAYAKEQADARAQRRGFWRTCWDDHADAR